MQPLNVIEESSTSSSLRIGWIGAGKMGAPMIRNLIACGHKLKVCDQNRHVISELEDDGAEAVSTLSGLNGIEVIFSTLPNDSALSGVVHGTAGQTGLAEILEPGSCFIEMSTVSPKCSEFVAKALSDKGISYLRAPLSGSTEMARAATLTVLASGDQVAWEKALPLLEHLSVRQFNLGTGDEARFMKLALNTLVGGTASLLAQAIELGRAGGLEASQMMSVINESAVASPLLKYKTTSISEHDYPPAFSVNQMIKDLSLIVGVGREHNIPMELMDLIRDQYSDASQGGFGELDFFSLVAWLKTAGIR